VSGATVWYTVLRAFPSPAVPPAGS
jgi:hypothetical protein